MRAPTSIHSSGGTKDVVPSNGISLARMLSNASPAWRAAVKRDGPHVHATAGAITLFPALKATQGPRVRHAEHSRNETKLRLPRPGRTFKDGLETWREASKLQTQERSHWNKAAGLPGRRSPHSVSAPPRTVAAGPSGYSLASCARALSPVTRTDTFTMSSLRP
jgi:hypothetical protein